MTTTASSMGSPPAPSISLAPRSTTVESAGGALGLGLASAEGARRGTLRRTANRWIFRMGSRGGQKGRGSIPRVPRRGGEREPHSQCEGGGQRLAARQCGYFEYPWNSSLWTKQCLSLRIVFRESAPGRNSP